MRILLAGDLHCYYSNYGRVDPSGTHSRLAEWRGIADALIRVAISRKVDIAVFPGDYYVNARPSPQQVLEVRRLFQGLNDRGIDVIGCPGNHDNPGAGQAGPCELLPPMGSSYWSITTPQVINARGLQVAVLPSVKPSALIAECADPAEANQRTVQALLDIARSLRAQCADGHKVLIGHWAIGGCMTSSSQTLGANEPVLPLGELLGLGFDAYLFGHIHKPQVLNQRPFVGYSGAFQRINFGEEDDARGCYIIDLDTGVYDWVYLPARRFFTLELDEDDIHDFLEGEPPAGFIGLNEARDTIARIVYRCNEELATQVDHNKLIEFVQAEEPHYFAGVFPEIERSERARQAGITETTSPLAALSAWLQAREMSPETRRAVQDEVEALLREVSGS